MKIWKWFYPRLLTFSICFTLGVIAVLIMLSSTTKQVNLSSSTKPIVEQSQLVKTYQNPEYIIKLITSSEPIIRRNIYKELFLAPKKTNIYYDYQRDLEYPERADNVNLQYVNLDKDNKKEAIITFNHLRTPTAIIMQKQNEGWIVVDTLSALGQMADTKLEDWLQTVSLIEPNSCELLIKKAAEDNSSYHSEFHILKLINGQLAKVGVIPIEDIQPYLNNQSNWQDIKHLTKTTYKISTNLLATITLSTNDSIVEYDGTIPKYTHWSDIDNSTHAYNGNWYNRSYHVLYFHEDRQNILEWDSQQQKFVIK